MISIISMAINVITGFLIYILKAFFSVLTWFGKLIFKLLRLFICALPVCGTLFFILLLFNTFVMLTEIPAFSNKIPADYATEFVDNLPDNIPSNLQNSLPQKSEQAISPKDIFSKDKTYISALFQVLTAWWKDTIYAYHGTISFIILLILTIIMIIPVFGIFLIISVFSSFGLLLAGACTIDGFFYVIRFLFGKSIVYQFLDRYYKLFPDKGQRHYEKSYERWLRRHHEEFEDEDRPGASKKHSFYDDNEDDYDSDENSDEYETDEDDDFYEDGEDEDFYEDEYESDDDYESDDEYEDEYDSDDDYASEDEYESDDDYESDNEYDSDDDNDFSDYYEDDFYKHKSSRHSRDNIAQNHSSNSFDFFAGCNSRESVDKKYRSLAKLYHPDNIDGDTAALQEINVQYEEAKKRFS